MRGLIKDEASLVMGGVKSSRPNQFVVAPWLFDRSEVLPSNGRLTAADFRPSDVRGDNLPPELPRIDRIRWILY